MRRLLFLFVLGTVVMIMMNGCYSRIDADYGTSHKLAKYNQIYDPDAEKNLEPVYGLNGIAVEGLMQRYQDSFKVEKKAPTYMFSVGDIGSGK